MHDKYGQRANGVLSSLLKFDSVFGLKLGYFLFGAAEQLSRMLLGKIQFYNKLLPLQI